MGYITRVLKIRNAEISGSKGIVIIGSKTYKMNGVVVPTPMIGTMSTAQETVWITKKATGGGDDD